MAAGPLSEPPWRRGRRDALLARIWQLRANASAYDAAYLALAETLDVPLVTRDGALSGVAGVRIPVEVFRGDRAHDPQAQVR